MNAQDNSTEDQPAQDASDNGQRSDDQAQVELSAATPLSATGETAGQILRRAREQAGMSIEELVSESRLSKSMVIALENDDTANLSKPVYIRGYYRKCAAILGVDEQGMIDAYNASASAADEPKPEPFRLIESSEEFDSRQGGNGGLRKSGGNILWFVAVAAVVLAAGLWMYRGGSDQVEPSDNELTLQVPQTGDEAALSSEASQTSSSEQDKVAASESAERDIVLPELMGDASSEGESEVASQSEDEDKRPSLLDVFSSDDETADEPAAEESAETAALEGDVVLQFDESSWVEIRDDNDRRLLYGLIREGESHSVSGAAPYDILLGNPQGIKMTWKGRAYNLERHIKPNRTARFSIGGS